jgi:excisionase family DNA binding protein
MHQRQQIGMRENPASDRRHGSRGETPSLSDSIIVEEVAANSKLYASPATPILPQTKYTNDAALPDAATGVEASKLDSTSRESLPHDGSSRVERPLTCEEAAQFVRVHPKTVKRMARTGDLPGHFRFGRWYFYASELDCWMRRELHSLRHSCR